MAKLIGAILINKEDILSKSRKENKDKDLYEVEVQVHAGSVGSLTGILLATILFVTQILMGDGFDFGLYAVIISISASGFIVKATRMKRKRDIVLATVYSIATLILTGIHVYYTVVNNGNVW
ncbi:DUF6442 family protein [Aureibacillus halotolerans]|uniref:Uncharacterized protein n=1 Tax=Aureibacillus halotolerans TaxID=1508390 RepID=A0A4R6U4S8_9BACI|nr:DUF6442 family protein [Aureibacillus halotolerans]TDQ39803.1 hypothetical protein EV213_107171 [Aureibacillus halotolerans]